MPNNLTLQKEYDKIITLTTEDKQMEIISRMNATRLGATRFYTGNLCSNGHDSERMVSNGQCVRCLINKTKNRNKNRVKKLRSMVDAMLAVV